MSSALLYAWFRNHSPPKGAFSKIYVPLLNLPRQDLNLRPEFMAVFKQCHIDTGNLSTLDDLPSNDTLPADRTQWILVDHNRLEGLLGKVYKDRVVGCIDHHDDEHAVPENTSTEPRIIEKCGSCTSLVLRELAQLAENPSTTDSQILHNADVLKLGLASILIDTNNLYDENKVKQADKDISERLNALLKDSDPQWSHEAFFKEIDSAKRSLEGLPLNDVLRKDYKQWEECEKRLGMSSVVKSLEFLRDLSDNESLKESDQQHWETARSNFMDDRKLHVWVIMTAYTLKSDEGDGGFKRQIMVHWRDGKSFNIVKKFEDMYGSELNLEPIDIAFQGTSGQCKWKVWQQGNIASSRKQVAPMLRDAIKQHARI